MGKNHNIFVNGLAWRRLYGEKTVRKVERARFLSEGEESEALNRVAFGSLGQKQRVLEPYSLSYQYSLLFLAKKGEKDNFPYGLPVSKNHHQSINPDPFASCGRKPVF